MARLANTIEAILYLKARPLTLAQLAEFSGCDRDATEEGLIELMGDYAHRDSALEIAETENGYCLQLKPPYKPLVEELIPLEIGLGALRTLAAIALSGTISQTDLVELRGSGAYQHVPELIDQGLVRKRRQSDGRSFWLHVTEKFYQRFEIDKLPKITLPKKPANGSAEDDEAAISEDAPTDDSAVNAADDSSTGPALDIPKDDISEDDTPEGDTRGSAESASAERPQMATPTHTDTEISEVESPSPESPSPESPSLESPDSKDFAESALEATGP
ncbi:MAG: SMC-Scp complex subunit ScpB [Cyanobacteria bacterium J06628_6]